MRHEPFRHPRGGDGWRQLWENREALDKYLARLKELMEEDERKKQEDCPTTELPEIKKPQG